MWKQPLFHKLNKICIELNNHAQASRDAALQAIVTADATIAQFRKAEDRDALGVMIQCPSCFSIATEFYLIRKQLKCERATSINMQSAYDYPMHIWLQRSS